MTTGNPTTGYSGDVFTLTDVVMTPAVPAVNQEVKITGKTKLFGIPFLGLVWITCDITYPKQGLDLTNPIGRYEAMGFGGKFTLNISKGFDRQGSFSTQILCYLGPTVKENLGVGGIVTLPPFPNVAAWPVFTFMVSGVLTSDFTVGTPVCPSQIEAGASINVVVPITNNTATDQTGKVTMQDKQQNSFLNITWNGKLVDTLTSQLAVPAGATRYASFTYTETTDIGSRDLIVKVTADNGAVLGSGEFDGIYSVIAPPAVSLKISPSTIKVGNLLSFTLTGLTPNEVVKLTNQGSQTELYSFTTDATGSYMGAFAYLGSPGNYVLVATDSSGKTASASYTVQPSDTNYVVTINPSTIPYGGTVHFTISGFPANYPVSFAIVTAEYPTPGNSVITVTTDSGGAGSGSFGVTELAGTYYLVNVNGFGTSTQFTVTGGPPTAPTLILTNNNTIQGGTITFEVWNFTPHFNVTVSEPNGNSVTLLIDGAGNVGGVITNTEPVGNYTLTARDSAGIEATASFTVVAPNPVSFKIYLFDPASLIVVGNQLGFANKILPGPTGSKITSWTCKYYDPVAQSLIGAGSNAPNAGVAFNNVHPGGYLVTTFSSSLGITPEIDSESFTAQNGDVWSFNPMWAQYVGWTGNMQKGGPVGIPTLTIANPSIAPGDTLRFTLSGFLPTEIVTILIGSRVIGDVTIDSSGNGQASFIDNDSPGNYTLQAFSAVTGNSATAPFTITAPVTFTVNTSVSPSGSGTVTANKNAPYTDGEVVTFTATPASGYSFQNIVINGVSYVDNPHTTTIIQNTTVVVTFQTGQGGTDPAFPAPSTDTHWYWVLFRDGSAGWFDDADYTALAYGNPQSIASVRGPYLPGATS